MQSALFESTAFLVAQHMGQQVRTILEEAALMPAGIKRPIRRGGVNTPWP